MTQVLPNGERPDWETLASVGIERDLGDVTGQAAGIAANVVGAAIKGFDWAYERFPHVREASADLAAFGIARVFGACEDTIELAGNVTGRATSCVRKSGHKIVSGLMDAFGTDGRAEY